MIVFDDMIADIESNKNLSPIVTELFLRGGKLNISLVFVSQSYFKVNISNMNFWLANMFYPKKTC